MPKEDRRNDHRNDHGFKTPEKHPNRQRKNDTNAPKYVTIYGIQ